jgi:hypothetical protein
VISKEFRDKWFSLLWALMFIALGAIGVLTGEFWTPRAKRSVSGVVGRIFGAIAFAFGMFVLVGWIKGYLVPDPDPADEPAPRSGRPVRARKRKPRPIDVDEEIAARALGLDEGRPGEAERPGPPPA